MDQNRVLQIDQNTTETEISGTDPRCLVFDVNSVISHNRSHKAPSELRVKVAPLMEDGRDKWAGADRSER